MSSIYAYTRVPKRFFTQIEFYDDELFLRISTSSHHTIKKYMKLDVRHIMDV